MAERLRVLATREFQTSIRESFHAELSRVITERPWLREKYEIGESYIIGENGTEFVFRGLRRSIASIRSMAAIDLCIVEEAENVPERSWQHLLPTVRAPRSEIWALWNPETDGSPVDSLLRKNRPPDALVSEIHYHDNPWFPAVLERQRRHDQSRLDPATYSHIWEGAYLSNSVAQVLHGKVRVDEFAPRDHWTGPYFGLDFGFSQDPTAATKCWVGDGRLWIEKEAGQIELELDATSQFLKDRIPELADHTIRADSSRPESISYLQRHGLPFVTAVLKWPNSVQDGISHLRSYKEIVVHPRCRETIRETRLYSYRTDRLTGDVMPDVIDAHNHYIDSIRYAIQPLISVREAGTHGLHVAGL